MRAQTPRIPSFYSASKRGTAPLWLSPSIFISLHFCWQAQRLTGSRNHLAGQLVFSPSQGLWIHVYRLFFFFFFWSSSSLSTERHFVFGACAPLGEIWLETTTSACLRPWFYHLLQLFRIKVQNWLFSTSVCGRGKCSRYNNLVLGFVLNFQMFCSVSFPLKDNFLCVQTEGRSHEPRWQLMKWLISTWMSRDSLSLLRLTPRNWKKNEANRRINW